MSAAETSLSPKDVTGAQSDSVQRLVLRLSDSVTIIRGDCRDMLSSLEFDAVVTDPPYGISFQRGKSGKGFDCNTNRKPIFGDDVDFDPTPLLKLTLRKSIENYRALVMFGPNHYASKIPKAGQWLVWDKSCGQGPANSFVDAEFIWMNRRNPRCIFRHFWMGALRKGEGNQNNSKRTHPSAKPVELMAWLIETARIGTGKTILDPYMGTGSTGVACIKSGRKFIGIEIDPDHFETARLRLEKELAQGRLGLTQNEVISQSREE